MNLNRLAIFIILLAILFGLYKYQEAISETVGLAPPKKRVIKKKKTKRKNPKLIEMDSEDDLSLDNISKLSIGSLENIKSMPGYDGNQGRGIGNPDGTGGAQPYKADSIFDSMDTDGSRGSNGSNGIDSLFESNSQASKESFFFQR